MEEINIPKHIAIIMDGNRRWAKNKNLPIKLGHKEGAKTLENIVRYAQTKGIKYLTVYAFSMSFNTLISHGCITIILASGTDTPAI